MSQDYFKANTQLVAKCIYFKETGKAVFEDYSMYYPTHSKRKMFN